MSNADNQLSGVPQPLVVQPAPSDPALLGLVVVVLGASAIALNFVNYVESGGAVVPLLTIGSGLFLVVATVWAARLGQSYLAGLLGAFGAFVLSYSALLLGLFHGWFAIAPTDVPETVKTFLIAWIIVVALFAIGALRLPVVFPITIATFGLALVIAFIAYSQNPPPDSGLLRVSGIVIFVFCALVAYLFLNASSLATGGRAYPLGQPVLK